LSWIKLGFLGFLNLSIFGILKNRKFGKLDLFPSSDEGVGDTYSAGSARKSQIQSLDIFRIPDEGQI
jgi:hypothetical protein